MSGLRAWRRQLRDQRFFLKARDRSHHMSEHEIVENVDLAMMTASRCISQYRHTSDREAQVDMLLEVRMNLEASLGMLDLVVPGG